MVSTPVRHFATGVFIPPAKVPMTTLCNVVDTGRLALPHIPVQVRWRTRRVERGAFGTRANGYSHTFHLAETLRMCQSHCGLKFRAAALLCAHLKNAARFLDDTAKRATFVDCQRGRLLTVDVLAGTHGVDRNLHVPMVWGADKNGINTSLVNEIPIVGVLRSVPTSIFGVVLFKMLFIYISNRHDVGKPFQSSAVRTSDASIANDTHSRPFIRRATFLGLHSRSKTAD